MVGARWRAPWRSVGARKGAGVARLGEAVGLAGGRDRCGSAARPGVAVDRVGATGGGPDEGALRGDRPLRGGLRALGPRGAAPRRPLATARAGANARRSGD